MKKAKKNLVLINSVAINGGDEALLKATILGFDLYFKEYNLIVLCNNPKLYEKHIDYVFFDWDWEYAFKKADNNESRFLYLFKKIIRILLNKILKVEFNSKFSRFFSSNREKRVYNILKESDLVVSSAGGYLHDFYWYNNRLRTFEFLKNILEKPYFIFAQSVGPFWKNENYEKLKMVFNNAESIILRENYSYNHLKEIGYHCKNVIVATDVAFNLYSNYGRPATKIKKLNKIIVNFRDWKYEDKDGKLLEKAIVLTKHLLNNDFELTFLSTCQGIRAYNDDALLSQKIFDSLDNRLRQKCTVLYKKYNLEDFIEKLKKHDAYIGMRLHGAILSLMTGLPSLNIAYEDKTFGIYDNLELSDYCFSFKEEESVWIEKTDKFIKDYDIQINSLDDKMKLAEQKTQQCFKSLI